MEVCRSISFFRRYIYKKDSVSIYIVLFFRCVNYTYNKDVMEVFLPWLPKSLSIITDPSTFHFFLWTPFLSFFPILITVWFIDFRNKLVSVFYTRSRVCVCVCLGWRNNFTYFVGLRPRGYLRRHIRLKKLPRDLWLLVTRECTWTETNWKKTTKNWRDSAHDYTLITPQIKGISLSFFSSRVIALVCSGRSLPSWNLVSDT